MHNTDQWQSDVLQDINKLFGLLSTIFDAGADPEGTAGQGEGWGREGGAMHRDRDAESIEVQGAKGTEPRRRG